MALPTKAKTWSISPCNRVTYTSVPQEIGDIHLALKTRLLTVSGCTVKGSCNGTTGAMDGTDRWTTSANVQTRFNGTAGAQSWIVLKFANMGGAELLLTYNAAVQQGFSYYMSPGGNYVVAGTANQKPTATDEVTINSQTSVIGSGTVDRLWTGWHASDGSSVRWAFAESGAFTCCVGVGLHTSRLEVGTWSPAVVGWRIGTLGACTGAFGSWTTACPATYLNPGGGGVVVSGFFGAEGYKTGLAGSLISTVSELQGGGYNIYPVAMGSDTATARGHVCNFVDLWAGNSSANDGDTYPNDATRTFIQIADFILPWDGSAPVMS